MLNILGRFNRSDYSDSGAGKILRKDLRVLAKQELMGRDPADDGMKAKL